MRHRIESVSIFGRTGRELREKNIYNYTKNCDLKQSSVSMLLVNKEKNLELKGNTSSGGLQFFISDS